MKKNAILATIAFGLMVCLASAAPVSDYELIADTLANGDTSLSVKIVNDDLIQGLTGTLLSGGFHVATPGDDTARLNTLTDGIFSAEGLNVIAADTDQSPDPSCVIEYTLAAPSDVWEVVAFSGHADDGARTFINIQVDVDTGSGYTPLGADLITGDYGTTKTAASVAYARVYDDAGIALATGVQKVRFTVQNVSHNSTGFFKKWDDNGPPENNYPNQGTILKELDVKTAPLAVREWTYY